MAAVPIGLDLNLQSSYGVLLIGCFFSAVIWGTSCLQTFLYFFMYNDPFSIRFMVIFLMAVDTANQVLVLKSVWPALILHWGRADILAKSEGTLELIHHVWVAAIVAVGVQLFYIYRIYSFGGRRWLLPCFLLLLTSWQIIGLAPYYFLVFGVAPVSAGQQSEQLTAVAVSIRASTAVADILIAAAMIYLLIKGSTNNHFANTQKLVFRLLLLSINSGTWTALLAILDLICIVAYPTYFTFAIFELPLCSLYLSTLLASLNARKFVWGEDPEMSVDPSDQTKARGTHSVFGSMHFVHPSPRRTAVSSRGDESPPDKEDVHRSPDITPMDGYV